MLAVRVTDQPIQSAKRYARKPGISLSRLIENYLNSRAIEQGEPLILTPMVRRLSSIPPADAASQLIVLLEALASGGIPHYHRRNIPCSL